MRNRAEVGAGWLKVGDRPPGGARLRLHPGNTAQHGERSGAGGATAQATLIRMAETAAGGLDVGLRPLALRAAVMICQGIEAGQTGARRQEDGEEEGRFDSEEV